MSQSTLTLPAEPVGGTPLPAPAAREPAAGTTPSPSAPAAAVGCPNCGNLESWGRSSWCPQCGFYPRLGISVEPALAARKEDVPAPKSPVEMWARIPVWGRVLCGGVLAIFVMSLLIRLGTAPQGFARSLLGVLQLAVGMGFFLTLHAVAVLMASMKSNRLGFIDAILHPFEVWRPTLQELPRTARCVCLASWGLTAALCAVVVIGGIRWSAIVDDWGFKKRAAANLADEIRKSLGEKAREEAGADNLNDAVKNLGGEGDSGTEGSETAAEESELDMLTSECVVIGYNLDHSTGNVSELLLGSVVEGELKYVGSVTEGIPENIQQQLAERLPTLERKTAVIKCPHAAVWVKPVISCMAGFKSWTENKQMQQPVFKELLADIDGDK
jgi:hypothetical protein